MCYMARLYWRLKLEGKWTYKRAVILDEDDYDVVVLNLNNQEEE